MCLQKRTRSPTMFNGSENACPEGFTRECSGGFFRLNTALIAVLIERPEQGQLLLIVASACS